MSDRDTTISVPDSSQYKTSSSTFETYWMMLEEEARDEIDLQYNLQLELRNLKCSHFLHNHHGSSNLCQGGAYHYQREYRD